MTSINYLKGLFKKSKAILGTLLAMKRERAVETMQLCE